MRHEKIVLAATSWTIPTIQGTFFESKLWVHPAHLRWTQSSSDHPQGKVWEVTADQEPPPALLPLLKCHSVNKLRHTNKAVFHLYETIKYDTISSIN